MCDFQDTLRWNVDTGGGGTEYLEVYTIAPSMVNKDKLVCSKSLLAVYSRFDT